MVNNFKKTITQRTQYRHHKIVLIFCLLVLVIGVSAKLFTRFGIRKKKHNFFNGNVKLLLSSNTIDYK